MISKEPTDVSRSYVKCLIDGGLSAVYASCKDRACLSTGGRHQNHLSQTQMAGDSESVSLEWGPACKFKISMGDYNIYSIKMSHCHKENFALLKGSCSTLS